MERHVHIKKFDSFTLKTVGYTLLTLAVLMLPSLIYNLVDGHDVLPFLLPMSAMMVIGIPMVVMTHMPKSINPIFILADMALMWFISVICGALPFFLSGFAPVDAIFESTSGVMTTGASIIPRVDEWSRGIIL